jgi:hypothetical protein
MRRVGVGILVGCALVLGVACGGSAAAAVTVGNGCVADSWLPLSSAVAMADDPSDPYQYPVPGNGVITGWSVRNTYTEFPAKQQLKVFRGAAAAKELTVVGESDFEDIGTGLNSFPTRVPVQAGDLIGLAGVFALPSASYTGSLLCRETKVGDVLGAVEGNPPVGATEPLVYDETEFADPATVTVEPDADGDGYGDETQDGCPTDPSTHGACPAPPSAPAPASPAPPAAAPATPVTLGTSAAVKKGRVIVTVTASAATEVTVSPDFGYGKSPRRRLTPKTGTVAPGSLARFTFGIPAPTRESLRNLPRDQWLTLTIATSTPGSVTKYLTVKVHGRGRLVRS